MVDIANNFKTISATVGMPRRAVIGKTTTMGINGIQVALTAPNEKDLAKAVRDLFQGFSINQNLIQSTATFHQSSIRTHR